MPRILHIDMDAFFASVEQQRNPELRGKPVIVGGHKDDRRGVVSTASYEAREFGVHSAMPIREAARRCPHGIFLRGNGELYSEISRSVKTILEEVSPLVEMASIDEAYIDISGSIRLFGGEDAIAAHIKGRIQEELGLTCTIGISANRMISKVASGLDKPNGCIIVPDAEGAAFLAPLNIERIPGIGPKLAQRLHGIGIATIGDLQRREPKDLERRFGNTAAFLLRVAKGLAGESVTTSRTPKSIGRETTFGEDSGDWSAIESTLRGLFEYAMHALRGQGLEARRLTLKVRSPDFSTHTYSKTLDAPTDVEPVVWNEVRALLAEVRKKQPVVRLIGFQVGELSAGQHQMTFDDQEHLTWEQAFSSVDAVRERFGFHALKSGRALNSRIADRHRPND